MARGWESKAIEAQQADHADRGGRPAAVSPHDIARRDARRTIELARARAAADLASATHPAHRRMLETALGALTEQLARHQEPEA